MKTVLIAALLLLTPAIAKADEVLKVDVNGLVCAFCATAIEKTFKAVDGIKAVTVDLDARVVTLTAEDGKAPDDATITSAIEDAGYNVVKINR